ncbi:GHMP family kinase ATP-binding protein [Nocardia fluminea]|uniref:Threonine kinase n=1 Tax=Nocardia fluminea TaxID=134984 RepID=A0A2N3V765_9NOCA|nr:kinase [Nocardia fluminea]PKV77465.1 threonine kinase [Nocardia fluminea]
MTIDLTVPGIGVGRAFGSCGELLQGVTAQDRHFLVTLPIRRGTVAVFEPSEDDIVVVPATKSKARRLATAMVGRSTVLRGGRLTLHSELPEGKGLASSTADLVATARAVADAEGRTVPVGELEADLRAIEPSDGVMYPGSVAYLHREVRLLARLGTLPALTIVTGDEGGSVDTVEFNRNVPRYTSADKREFDTLLSLLGTAITHGDLATIGAVATRSAVLSAASRERPHLDATIRAARAIGAAGVVVAHSGTTTGILLASDDPDLREQVVAAQQLCAGFACSVAVHHSWRPGPHRVPAVDHAHSLSNPRTESSPR